MNLRLVEGKQSLEYNHFEDFTWDSCLATDTRLMGVVALRICWKSKTSSYRIYQILHLDFSEYGIDEYMEYYTDPNLKQLGSIHSKREFNEQWQRVSGGLGGKEIFLPLGAVIQLIHMVLETNREYYHYHENDIQEFRQNVIPRMDLMKQAAEKDPGYEAISPLEATRLVCLHNLSTAETINYFLMRMCDKDYLGAAILSTLTEEELQGNSSWHHEMMTLIHNRITPIKGTNQYHCTTLTEGPVYYYYARINLELDTSRGKRNARVSGFRCPYFEKCSEVEMAMQMKHPEYITVYQMEDDMDNFDPDESHMLSGAIISPVPNGILFMMYNKTNNHVNCNNYYMNNDVYGACIITPMKEFVMMSPEIMNISAMELDIETSFLRGELTLKGRYRFDSQVFQTFTELSHVTFSEIIQD